MTEFDWIADDESLADVVTSMGEADRYAVDTEFHRERTYFPRVALVQLALARPDRPRRPAGGRTSQPLAKVLDGPGIAVMHAAGQDLEVLELGLRHRSRRRCSTRSWRPGSSGYATPSLAALAEQVVGVRLPKGDRLTDWLRRPLDADQLRYAASRRRPPARDPGPPDRRPRAPAAGSSGRSTSASSSARAAARCGPRGRVAAHQGGPPPPRRAPPASPVRWRRGASDGRPRSTSRSASSCPTSASSGSRSGPPKSRDQLRAIRGLDDRHVRGPPRRRAARGGRRTAASARPSGPGRTRSSSSSASCARRSRWCRPGSASWPGTSRIDTSLLATRADIEALLRRHRGRPAQRGLAGRAWSASRSAASSRATPPSPSTARAGLLLEERSHKRIV